MPPSPAPPSPYGPASFDACARTYPSSSPQDRKATSRDVFAWLCAVVAPAEAGSRTSASATARPMRRVITLVIRRRRGVRHRSAVALGDRDRLPGRAEHRGVDEVAARERPRSRLQPLDGRARPLHLVGG